MSTLNARIKLRRDNDYNYASNFVPLFGEVCLVDTAKEGLKVKVGDGITPFGSLDWYYPVDFGQATLILGYYYNNQFYYDAGHTELAVSDSRDLYIDKNQSIIYYYTGAVYKAASTQIVHASEVVDGIMRLYNTTGQNIDGTMTQKSITDGLEELKLTVDGETLSAQY